MIFIVQIFFDPCWFACFLIVTDDYFSLNIVTPSTPEKTVKHVASLIAAKPPGFAADKF